MAVNRGGFLVPSLLLLLLLLLVEYSSADLCAGSDYPDLCRSVVKGESLATAATAKAIKATQGRIRKAMATARGLVDSQKGTEKANADTCVQVFTDALDSLDTSLKNLKGKDTGSLNSQLSAVVSDISTCKDTYAERPGQPTPLDAANTELAQLASNNLALAAEVHF